MASITELIANAVKKVGDVGVNAVKQNAPASASNNAGTYYTELLNKYNAAQAAATPDYSGANNYLKSSADSQKEILQSQYDQGARNAYINYMQAKRDLPQQMGALGLGGTGLSESSLVGLNADYGNNLSTLRNNLSNGVRSIDSDVASKIYSSLLGQADATASANSSAVSAYAKLLSGNSGSSGGTSTEYSYPVTTTPIKTVDKTASNAIVSANRSSPNSQTGQIAYIAALNNAGKISDKQATNLAWAITHPGK